MTPTKYINITSRMQISTGKQSRMQKQGIKQQSSHTHPHGHKISATFRKLHSAYINKKQTAQIKMFSNNSQEM
jgi:hypothetical protein